MSMKDNIILRAAEIIEDYQMHRYGMAVYKQNIIPVVKEWYEKGNIVDLIDWLPQSFILVDIGQ